MKRGSGSHRYQQIWVNLKAREIQDREAAFDWVVNATGNMSQTDSEMGAQGALGILAASYLLKVEKECYRALAKISELSSETKLVRISHKGALPVRFGAKSRGEASKVLLRLI